MTLYLEMESPLGPLTISEENGAVTGVDFGPCPPDAPRAETPLLKEAVRQLTEYFEGRRREFDLPLRPRGTVFRQKVWTALQTIPYGTTWSYGELARQIGKAGAARAVGGANHHNPIAIVIPCHRIIGASGELVGYGGGLDKKRFLLELERKIRQQAE